MQQNTRAREVTCRSMIFFTAWSHLCTICACAELPPSDLPLLLRSRVRIKPLRTHAVRLEVPWPRLGPWPGPWQP